MSTPLQLTAGDLITRYSAEDDAWYTTKILLLEDCEDGTETAHCLLYEATTEKPTLESIETARVLFSHAPYLASIFLEEEEEKLGSQAPTKQDLSGFVTYLKTTDFPRYVSFTGQNLEAIVALANEHYKNGCALADEGQPKAAIAEYDRTIDLFPHFHEAIDNRAYVFMGLENYEEALEGFQHSLQVNPEGAKALIAKGTCLMRLGRLEAAETIFEEGLKRFSDKQEMFGKALRQVRHLQEA